MENTLTKTIEALEKARSEIKDMKETDAITIKISKYGLKQIITALKMSRAFDEIIDEEIEIQRIELERKYKKENQNGIEER